ncbi:MAG: M14 family zinc carboxypeptidase [Pseudomonadota bacterium]
MAARLKLSLACAGLALSCTSGAQILTYTEATNSATEIALGYPVPTPVDSVTAVAGFRLYEGLHAQHQDLALGNAEVSGHIVGTTRLNRDIWAYRIGDADTVNTGGITEPAVLINGGIHAREWASPEVVTELFEQLVERKVDGGVVQYIVENVNTVLLPVNNVDGFIQTQRYPTQVTPTPPGPPVVPESELFDSPRDGRMRRKNMLDVDEDLATDADRLLGVDLNRNNAQFFDNGGNSPDPASIVYRGSAPASEPEILALQAAAGLAPVDRLRLFVDTHSFGRVMFVPTPPNPRQNANTRSLVNKVAAATGTDPRHPAYVPVFNQPNTGISGTASFFSYTYDIPAWTLEIEPPQGFPGIPNAGAYYGGFGVSHDGFILPASEIERVRDELTVASILALYNQAGPPAVQAVQVADATGNVVYAAEWQNNGDGTRSLLVGTNTALVADGSQYSIWLAFDKPMRFLDPATGTIGVYPGQSAVNTQPVATLVSSGNQLTANFAFTDWPLTPGGAPSGYIRYQADAVTGTFSIAPNSQIASATPASLAVLVADMGGQLNDGDPSTVVDFANGGWTGYENASGLQGDTGGRDESFGITVNPGPASPGAPPPAQSGGGGGAGSLPGLLILALLLSLIHPRRRRTVSI